MSGPAWRRYLRFWGRDAVADLDDELRFHLDSCIQDLVASGMGPAQARAEALRRFGDVERVRARCEAIDHLHERDRRRADMWDALMQDLRYAARTLRRNPGFAAIAVLTLALGIGANTAIFSVVNGVLLRPLPYDEPDRLVRLYTAFRGNGEERYSMSQPEFMDYKGLTQVFENAAAFTGVGMTLTGGCAAGAAAGVASAACEPERVRGVAGTRELLPVLGVLPARGRNFEGEEGRQGMEPVVIVTHDFWQNRFGGDPGLLGRTLTLNGINRRVVGILPPDATFERAEAIIPLYINPDSLTGRSSNYLNGVARLRPGVGVEQAQRELNALTRRLQAEHRNAYPESMGFGATVIAMHDEIVGDIRPALLVLLGAVGLVLLIACANVANLLLARGEARQREMAVRLALGAGRGRMVRQLLTESMVLALLGAAAGVVLAWWGMKTLLAVNPDSIPRVQEIRIDGTVALATLGIAMLTGVVFGLAPAMQLVRSELQSSLKEGTRGGTESGNRHRLGRALVMGEIALAMVVVIGAGLLMRSFWTLRNVDGGFSSAGILAVDLAVPPARYDAVATAEFYRRVVERAGGLPGVQTAAAVDELPPVAGSRNWDIAIDGRPPVPGQAYPSPNIREVTHGYFRALSIPVARGRLFGAEDAANTMPVGILNESAARRIWGDDDPIGQRVRFSREQPWITIVGVARDTRSAGLAEEVPSELYLLHEQMPVIAENARRAMYVVLRTSGDPSTLAAPMRSVIREMDPLLAIVGMRTMDEIVDLSIARPRFTMLLLGVFGAVALTLASIGIYGVMSYAVRRRTREIGIRMALGAKPADVLRLVVGQGMRLALLGLGAGVAAALLATRLMTRLLYGVSATDPLTFVAIALLLAAVALVANWLPARRAIRTDPTTALRAE